MEPTYKIEIFEGPLDLLLSLIYKNKIDITDIPIALLCDQYLAYLDEMQKMDMDIAGEFLVMASELMLIKSRMLLPQPEGEEKEDPRTQLANALIEYKHAKEVAADLDEMIKIYGGRMVKDTEEIPADDSFIAEHNVMLLKRAMTRMLLNAGKRELLEREAMLARPLMKVRPSVTGKILGVLKRIKRKGRQKFDDLFDSCKTKSDLVAVFMAVLELLKVSRITVSEPDENEDIYIDINSNYVKPEGQTDQI